MYSANYDIRFKSVSHYTNGVIAELKSREQSSHSLIF